jgi:hypothetical protein
MDDILSQGGDRDPSPWPRRLAVIGVALAIVVLGVVYVSRARQPHSPAAAPSTAASATAAEPTAIAGAADLPVPDSLRLPVAGVQPAWFSPASGRSVRIGGLPADSAGYQFIRAKGGWVVRAGSGGSTVSGDTDTPPLPVWFLADGAQTATRIGTANQVTPAATAGAVWLTTLTPSADPDGALRTAQEVSVTGVPLGRPVMLGTGYAIYQATDRGLLLTPVSQDTKSQPDRLVNPANLFFIEGFDSVLAASPDQVAWTPRCGATCHVQVLNLKTGRETAIKLPPGSFAESGAFSPSGNLLALQILTDQGSVSTTGLEVASIASGRLTDLPGASVSGDTVVDYGWPTAGDTLVAEFIFPATVQLASWHPGASALSVANIRPGQEQTSLVVG